MNFLRIVSYENSDQIPGSSSAYGSADAVRVGMALVGCDLADTQGITAIVTALVIWDPLHFITEDIPWPQLSHPHSATAPISSVSLREATLARADVSLLTGSDSERQASLDFFDYLVHDSVAGFGMDRSKLENWRMMYFGDLAYEPANNWSLVDGSEPLEKFEARA
jgi:hypothetical protein